MLIDILLLAVGLIILILGANWMVDGASSIASRLGISAFIIGLTVVAFGTSLPELVVNIIASAKGSSGLAIGNVVGSNTINIMLVVGLAAIVKPVKVQSITIRVEIPFSLLAAIILLIIANDRILDNASSSVLSRADGLILITLLGVFLYYTFMASRSDMYAQVSNIKPRKGYLVALMIAGGIAGLYFGAKLIVDSSISIASALGVSDSLIGLTVVAIGTSLPELATSVVAAFKGESDIAIGNVLGSNIFNIFMVLGVSSIIMPLPLYPSANIDIIVSGIAIVMLFAFVAFGKGKSVTRTHGWIFVLSYLAYIIFLIKSV